MVIVGLYLLVFHADPWPLNHEDIGPGDLHVLHDVIGIVMLAAAGFVWWRSKRAAKSGFARGG